MKGNWSFLTPIILCKNARFFRDIFLFGTMLHCSGRVGGWMVACLVIEIVIIRVTLQGQTPSLPPVLLPLLLPSPISSSREIRHAKLGARLVANFATASLSPGPAAAAAACCLTATVRGVTEMAEGNGGDVILCKRRKTRFLSPADQKSLTSTKRGGFKGATF